MVLPELACVCVYVCVTVALVNLLCTELAGSWKEPSKLIPFPWSIFSRCTKNHTLTPWTHLFELAYFRRSHISTYEESSSSLQSMSDVRVLSEEPNQASRKTFRRYNVYGTARIRGCHSICANIYLLRTHQSVAHTEHRCWTHSRKVWQLLSGVVIHTLRRTIQSCLKSTVSGKYVNSIVLNFSNDGANFIGPKQFVVVFRNSGMCRRCWILIGCGL